MIGRSTRVADIDLLGSFTLDSGIIYISDPAYEKYQMSKNGEPLFEKRKAKNGEWYVEIEKTTNGLVRAVRAFMLDDFPVKEVIGNKVRVDTGQLCIINPNMFNTEFFIHDQMKNDIDREWKNRYGELYDGEEEKETKCCCSKEKGYWYYYNCIMCPGMIGDVFKDEYYGFVINTGMDGEISPRFYLNSNEEVVGVNFEFFLYDLKFYDFFERMREKHMRETKEDN